MIKGILKDQPGDIYSLDFDTMVRRYKPSGESLFSLEAAILKELDHPGTVKFISEYVAPDGRQYFIMKKPSTARFT